MADVRVSHTRIDDLDRPLHRIFPQWFFFETLRLRRLTLVQPRLWSDPRKDPCSTFVLQHAGKQQQLADWLLPAWAQCWSYEASSDLLLRAYSRVSIDPHSNRNADPVHEGIRVTTTARRLVAAMENWAAKHQDRHFYLARVVYEPTKQFGQNLVNLLARPEGPRFFSSPDGRAESLFVKRDYYRHEDEVRLVCVSKNREAQRNDLLHLPIEPDTLFTEVSFDPRLAAFERKEREKLLRDHGFAGSIKGDNSYAKVFAIIQVPAPWDPPTSN